MSDPITTVAALKRALTPGTRIHVENHFRPVATRDTVVLDGTNTVDLVTWATNDAGTKVKTHTQWPKRADFRPDGDQLHIMCTGTDQPFITITITEGSPA